MASRGAGNYGNFQVLNPIVLKVSVLLEKNMLNLANRMPPGSKLLKIFVETFSGIFQELPRAGTANEV